jgi:hypothetical protein
MLIKWDSYLRPLGSESAVLDLRIDPGLTPSLRPRNRSHACHDKRSRHSFHWLLLFPSLSLSLPLPKRLYLSVSELQT